MNAVFNFLIILLEGVADKQIRIIQNLVYSGKYPNDEQSKPDTYWQICTPNESRASR